ncbi:hypothetical protein FY528_03555 [Hymenobacter lutimineralis]|uniref:Uncharacterized protein n=1 Tax=Hymenobacter lutimineralis TaxID=2606448 RepID=A0A5D6VDX9_9BACT|nr:MULTISPECIES: hypothetical protein [Hymenobacter]QIX61282.1 hypothetical protein HER32_08850 [Hymenobacter sp. BT18]TYZ13497.1 hypothetical protein FY528_03555 [Hymenobacter lutimineralis]
MANSTRYLLLLCVSAVSLASCQSSKTALQHRSTQPRTNEQAVVLMHDSQGPEPTSVLLSADAEPTPPRKNN